MTHKARQSDASSGTSQPASPQDASVRLATRQARTAARALEQSGVRPGGRVLDLGCGLGRQAVALDRLGYRVTGLDIRHDAEVLEHWSTARRHHPTVRFVSGDARHLPLTGPFDAALLLYNSLALFHTNEAAIALWSDVRRILAPTGVLIIDNICRSLWTEIAAGRYADGISEDGLWQMTWLPGRNVFSLRYGHQVRPDHPRPRRGETLYRAWSLDELDLLCRLTGWQLEPASLRRSLLVARPTNDQATR